MPEAKRAKKQKYVVRVTVVTEERVTKKAVRKWVDEALSLGSTYPCGPAEVVAAKASTVDEE